MVGRFLAVMALLVLGGFPVAGAPLPRTPAALVDGSGGLAQVGEGARVRLSWDVRALGASGVRVRLHRWPLRRPDAHPDLEFTFEAPAGQQVVKFQGLDRGVYRVQTVALGPSGTEVGGPSFPVYVEYGGWRAWDGMDREQDLRADPPPLAGVGASYVPREDLPALELSPTTGVVKPSGEVVLRATLRNMPEDTSLEWELEGPGDLDPSKDGREAKYTAPEGGANEVARVRVFAPGTAAADGRATLLVTPVKVGGEPGE